MFKRLPVLPARRDSRRLTQQVSRCSKRLLVSASAKRFAAAAGAAGFPLFKGCRVLPARRDSRRRLVSRLPVVQKAAGFTASAFAGGWRNRLPVVKKGLVLPARSDSRRLTQRVSRCSKRLLVLPARSDSQRRPAQQASRCSKGCQFCLREAIRGGSCSQQAPVVQKVAGSACAKKVRGGWRSRLPVVQRLPVSGCAKRFTAGAGAASFPLLKRRKRMELHLCGGFRRV